MARQGRALHATVACQWSLGALGTLLPNVHSLEALTIECSDSWRWRPAGLKGGVDEQIAYQQKNKNWILPGRWFNTGKLLLLLLLLLYAQSAESLN